MTSTSRIPILFLLLLSAACAGSRGGRASAPAAAMHQADERIPPISAFEPGQERIAYNEALTQEQQGWQLESAGDTAGARRPLSTAARGYLAFVDRFPNFTAPSRRTRAPPRSAASWRGSGRPGRAAR